ncbi:hypothetical protein ACPF7Z_12540 [Halomonas sp. GXIMD04776]|uniref:hypothetical protein n=1 Tax=Halomonas sp. GXIMD04776 TaxID=3415605 RepID=UPI003CA0DB12
MNDVSLPFQPFEKHPPVVKDQLFSNYGGVFLWSLETLKPIAQFNGNSSKVDAAISPDGQWVVSGDENTIGLYWNTNQPEKSIEWQDIVRGFFSRILHTILMNPENLIKAA